MAILIKNVRGTAAVTFDKGSFDEWCVYLQRVGQSRYAPRDTEYFNCLKQLAHKHGVQKMYNDFNAVYEHTSKHIDTQTLQLISTIADTYHSDANEIDVWFTVIYAGMIAEENKAFAKLKKRIKRLGMHQVLLEGVPVEVAANYSRGKHWRDLDVEMYQRGF